MKIESLERVLREHALTQGLPEAQVRFIPGCAKNTRFGAGEYLFHEGDESNELYLVRSGRISLELDVPPRGVVEIETVGPGGAEVGGGWFYHEFDVGSYVSLTSQVRVRFIADDAATSSPSSANVGAKYM